MLPFAPHWLGQAEDLRRRFWDADPFPHVVIDGFLHADAAEQVLADFPPLHLMPKSRDYVFADKRELASVEQRGPGPRCFRDGVLSEQFKRFLKDLTGFDLFVDPTFLGGGFHQGGDGSFLDMHVDFNVHPLNRDWLRTLNILVYLNKDWRAEYGGELLIRNGPEGPLHHISPEFNRAVVMLTDERTFHGYRRMSLPEGVTRKSLAAYAYRIVDESSVKPHTTGWAPENAGPLKRFMARHYNRAVLTKNRFLGSRTARNR